MEKQQQRIMKVMMTKLTEDVTQKQRMNTAIFSQNNL